MKRGKWDNWGGERDGFALMDKVLIWAIVAVLVVLVVIVS